jgi:hypothetical protein
MGMGEHSSQFPTRPDTPAVQQRVFFPVYRDMGKAGRFKPGTESQEELQKHGERTGGRGFTRMTPDPEARDTVNERIFPQAKLLRHGWKREVRSTTDTAGHVSHYSGSRPYGSYGGSESDEELWNRKYEEGEERGLHEGIEEEGGIKRPVSLGSKKGSMGKKEIVGGHHRLAYMREQRPEDLMPVLHFQDIYEARAPSRTKNWPYT